MIKVTYNNDGIRVDVGEISKYSNCLPFKLKIIKHVSGEVQWSTDLYDSWYATFPSVEMFDVVLTDRNNTIIYRKEWDIFEHGNYFYKSLWLYNKKIISQGKFPKGLVIGTHDGEFGEWVPIAKKRDAQIVLVEASDNQFKKLKNNYKNNSLVKCVQEIITPSGGEVVFYEGGQGYTNTVVEKVIRNWETEEIHSTTKNSIDINEFIRREFDGDLDWLHLDVEGLDAKLIMAIDEGKIKLPDFIIFEDFNLSETEKSEIYEFLKSRNFNITSDSGICEAIR